MTSEIKMTNPVKMPNPEKMPASEKKTDPKKTKSRMKNAVRNLCKGREGQFGLLLSCIFMVSVTLMAATFYKGPANTVSADEMRSHTLYDKPWVVKSDGRPLVYVENEQTGRQILLGLKIKYCNSLASQQKAQSKNLITCERAPLRVYHTNEVMNVREAVDTIAGMNRVAVKCDDTNIGNNKKKKTDDPADKTITAGNDRAGNEAAGNDAAGSDTASGNNNITGNDNAAGDANRPPVTIALNQVVEEDQDIQYKTKVIKTDKLVRGEKEVKNKGELGSKHVVSDVVMENGEYAGSKVLDSKVTEKAVTKVVYEGTKLTTSDKGELLVQYATRFLGTKYVLGGADERKGIDCSGFTMRMYGKLGIKLPHYSYDQEHCGVDVKYEDAQPGDLILYPGHVGIYMGNNMMIHATPGEVKITDDCRYREITCIRRIFTDDDNVTQDMFDELFKEEYNEGAEELAKEKLSKLDYYTMKNETGNSISGNSDYSDSADPQN